MGFWRTLWSGVKSVVSAVWNKVIEAGRFVIEIAKKTWIHLKSGIPSVLRWVAEALYVAIKHIVPGKLKIFANWIRKAIFWLADKIQISSDEDAVLIFLEDLSNRLEQIDSLLEEDNLDFENHARFSTVRRILGELHTRLVKNTKIDTLDQDDIQLVVLTRDIVNGEWGKSELADLDEILLRKRGRDFRSIVMEEWFFRWKEELKAQEENLDQINDKLYELEQCINYYEVGRNITLDNLSTDKEIQSFKFQHELLKNQQMDVSNSVLHLKLITGVAEGIIEEYEMNDDIKDENVLKAADLLLAYHKSKESLSDNEIDFLETLAARYYYYAKKRVRIEV
jgi:hypothetical protein